MSKKENNYKFARKLEQPLLEPLFIKTKPLHESGSQLKHNNDDYVVNVSPKKEEETPGLIKKIFSYFKFKWIFPLTPYS